YGLLKRLEQERRLTVRGGIVVGIVTRQHVQQGDISLVECRNCISRNRVRVLSGLWVERQRHRRFECWVLIEHGAELNRDVVVVLEMAFITWRGIDTLALSCDQAHTGKRGLEVAN